MYRDNIRASNYFFMYNFSILKMTSKLSSSNKFIQLINANLIKFIISFSLIFFHNFAFSQCKPILSLHFSGNTQDQSGNNDHGMLNGVSNNPILTNDRYNNPKSAYQFGGYYNQNWILVPNSPSLALGKSVSLSLWFKQCSFAGMDGNGRFAQNGYFQLIQDCCELVIIIEMDKVAPLILQKILL